MPNMLKLIFMGVLISTTWAQAGYWDWLNPVTAPFTEAGYVCEDLDIPNNYDNRMLYLRNDGKNVFTHGVQTVYRSKSLVQCRNLTYISQKVGAPLKINNPPLEFGIYFDDFISVDKEVKEEDLIYPPGDYTCSHTELYGANDDLLELNRNGNAIFAFAIQKNYSEGPIAQCENIAAQANNKGLGIQTKYYGSTSSGYFNEYVKVVPK